MLYSEEDLHFLFSSKWKMKDIIGYDDAKEALYKKVIVPIINKKLHGDSGIRHPVCILLHGPTHFGKLMLMRAVRNETETKINIFTRNESKLIDSGEYKSIFNDIFQRAANHGTSSIIFINEFRSKRRHEFDIMNYLLEEMNRASDLTDVYVVISTNNPRIKYDLFLRPGFVSSAFYVGLPHPKFVIKYLQPGLKESGEQFDVFINHQVDEFFDQCKIYSYLDWIPLLKVVLDHTHNNENWNGIYSREHFIIAINTIRPSISSMVVRRFLKSQSRYEKNLKNATKIKSDVLAKSFSTF